MAGPGGPSVVQTPGPGNTLITYVCKDLLALIYHTDLTLPLILKAERHTLDNLHLFTGGAIGISFNNSR